ncbi:hypothetical protein AWENTII_003976 [Aspergillus wentii]|nr:hypothetical protein MW887_007472 [Aspergillus wentii]
MKPQQWLISHHNPRVWSRVSRNIAHFNVPITRQQSRFSTSSELPARQTTHHYRPLQVLQDATIDRFREACFNPELPAILPRRHFRDLPALERWFRPSDANTHRINAEYLEKHGADASVPLELTQPSPAPAGNGQETDALSFRQFHAPLSLFLQWMRASETQPQAMRLYLAQCQLLDLPQVLRDDFPAPDIVSQAGNGDIYDTNVWIGHPPTYTPLHRDPNPNLFVQLAGQKIVRLLAPDNGLAVFGSVRRQLGKSGNHEAAAFRGEEMMQGQERTLLEQMVWDDGDSAAETVPEKEGYEAHLEAGDGLFIPKGWWHSIKGVGEGVTGSVNWWFR